KGSQVLHLVDGMRLNNAFFRSAPNQYLGLVDPYATGSVEVLRGAAGTLYGADAMGGVVNVLTPEPQLPGSPGNSGGRIYGAWSSADDGWVGHADFSGATAQTGFLLGASYQDRGDRETGDGVLLRPSGFRSRAANAKLLHRFGEDSELMLAVQLLEQPSTPRTDELVPGFGQSQPSASEFEFMPNRREFFHGRYRWHGSGGWLDELEIHAARQVIEDDRRTRDFESPLRNEEQNRSTLDGLTVQFNSDGDNGVLLTWGLEYYSDTVRSARTRRDIITGLATMVASRFPDGSTMDSAAAYLSSEWQPTSRLDLGAGLRYSHFDISLPAAAGPGAVRLTPSDLTGDLHAVWALSDRLNLVANLGRGFRPPNIFDLGTLGPRPGNRFNVANPALAPESVWSYDLGLKASGGRWQSELFIFAMDYSDKITEVATGDFTPEGRAVVRSENRNEVRLYGLEAGFRWFASPRTSLSGVLNYTRGTESDGQGGRQPADRIPPLNGRLGAAFQAMDRLRLRAELDFAGRQERLSSRDIGDPRIDPAGTPGWVSLNLRLDWQLDDRVSVGLNLENLADRHYREHASGLDAPGFNAGLWVNLIF
ncbi:MAG TPA: TonB-dependent receptor, partial [Xanthomonadales bacterium]|nr:TonB-dependent receptor [Xanthomonadales bacterium]